jgi:multidrug resistance protein
MQFVFAPVLGRLSDRVGRRPVILVSLAGSCVASLLFGVAQALWMLFVARILDGLSGASYAAAQAYVADVTPPEERAGAMGMIGAAFGLGFIIGPALGGLFAAIDRRVPFFIAAALAAGNLALAWRRLPESRQRRSLPGRSRREILRDALARRDLAPLVWISFIGTLAFVAMETTFALFAERRFGFSLAETGLVFAYIGVIIAAVQGGAIRPLVRRGGEVRVLIAGLVGTAVGLALLAATEEVWELLLVLLLMSASSGLVFPTVTGLVSRRASAEEQGGVLGVLASTGGAARVIAPIAGTALLEVRLGLPYVVGAALFAACAVIVARGVAGLAPGPAAPLTKDA